MVVADRLPQRAAGPKKAHYPRTNLAEFPLKCAACQYEMGGAIQAKQNASVTELERANSQGKIGRIRSSILHHRFILIPEGVFRE